MTVIGGIGSQRMWAAALLVVLAVGAVALGASAEVVSPPPVDPALASEGFNLYQLNCRACHGAEGRGDGTVAEVLTVPPADLTALAAANGGVFPYELAIQVVDGRKKVPGHGSSDMPVWGNIFSQGDSEAAAEVKIEQLVHYLMSIQEADTVARRSTRDGTGESSGLRGSAALR